MIAHRTRRAAILSATALTLALMTGCAATADPPPASSGTEGSLADLVAAAQEEGTVVFYSAFPEGVLQEIQTRFSEEYGIEVQYQRLASGPLQERVSQEVSSGNVLFDVVQTADDAFVTSTAGEGYWAEVSADEIPELANLPEDLVLPTYAVSSITAAAVIYNSDSVTEGELPRSTEDLLDPRWKDRMALLPPGIGGSADATYALWLDEYGEDGFRDFMEGLHAQNPLLVESGSNGAQLVAAGELDLALMASNAFVADLVAKGAPVAATFPDPSGAVVRPISVAAEAAHPHAARLLMNWLLSPTGLEIINGNGQAAPPYPLEGSTAAELPDTVSVVDSAQTEGAAATVLEIYNEVFE